MRKKTEKEKKLELVAKKVTQKPETIEDRLNNALKRIKAGKLTYGEFGIELGLDEKQIQFASAYLSENLSVEQAAMKVYGIDRADIQAAKIIGKKLIKNQDILTLINAMMPDTGYSVENAEKQIGWALNQHENPRIKLDAAKLTLQAHGKLNKKAELTVRHQFETDNLPKDEIIALKKQIASLKGETFIDIEFEELDNE